MDLNSLYLINAYNDVPIYRFDINTFLGHNPSWTNYWNSFYDIEVPVYSPLRRQFPVYAMPVELILKINADNSEIANRHRMRERILVRM